MNEEEEDDKIKEFKMLFKLDIGKSLGRGKYGLVKEIHHKNQVYAGKLVKKEGIVDECELILQFKSPYIVKIVKIFNSGEFNLILMEKGLSDLNQFIKRSRNNEIQKLIISPFYDGIIGENLFKYFAKHLIIGLESLERISFSHFDIKPGNILIFKNLILKLSDFSFLRNQKEADLKNMMDIPGGTDGYSPPEYYSDYKVTIENAKKHDYFSLGSTLFNLKYGENLFIFPDSFHKDRNKKKDQIIEYIYNSVERQMNLIKSSKYSDKGFINFLCGLIQFKPEERPNFKEIYYNKWLNKNSKEISKICKINELNDSKLVLELNKSDFLINKRNSLNKERKKFIFKRKRK